MEAALAAKAAGSSSDLANPSVAATTSSSAASTGQVPANMRCECEGRLTQCHNSHMGVRAANGKMLCEQCSRSCPSVQDNSTHKETPCDCTCYGCAYGAYKMLSSMGDPDSEVRQLMARNTSTSKAVPIPPPRSRLPSGRVLRCPDLTVWGTEDSTAQWQCPHSRHTVSHRGRNTIAVCVLCCLRLEVEQWRVSYPLMQRAWERG